MNVVRTAPEAAILIKWPQSAPLAVAREASKRLTEACVPATWSLDQASQVAAMASWGVAGTGGEVALIGPAREAIAGAATELATTRELTRRLELLREAGWNVRMVHGAGELAVGHWPRTLRAMGVEAIVSDSTSPGVAARALPFGVWHFTPHAVAPRTPHWTNWFRSRRSGTFGYITASPVVVTIDLAGAAAESRAWREIGSTLAEAAEARSRGALRLATMGELVTRFTQSHAPRPQRSILRAA